MFQVNRITIRGPTWSDLVFGIAVFILVTANPVFGQKTAQEHNERGKARYKKGNIEGALADFEYAIKIDPKLAKAYANRGAIKDLKKDIDGAIADYTRAIELYPKFGNALQIVPSLTRKKATGKMRSPITRVPSS